MAFQIIRNDITKVSADAIVNTANPRPVFAGGTDGAVYRAAGEKELLEERKKIGDIQVGQAASTPAFALDAKYIIHTVGPAWIDGKHGEREAVRSCYENSLKLARELGCESIAFPLIATGIYGFPKADALSIAVSVFSSFLAGEDMKITLVVFDEESFVLSDRIFTGVDEYIDDNYVNEKTDEEYMPRLSAPPRRRVFDKLKAGFDRKKERPAGSAARESVPFELAMDDEESSMPFLRPEDKLSSASSLSMDMSDSEMPVFSGMAMSAQAMPQDKDMGMTGAGPTAGRSLDELMAHIGETWQESLFRIIDEKGYTDTEVYKRANIDRKLFSKIRSNAGYQPKKITAVALALALKLNLDETKDILKRAGYALSPSSRFDLIIQYFIENEVYDTYTINLALFDHGQPLLGE